MLHKIAGFFTYVRFLYWKGILQLFQGSMGSGTRVYEGVKFSPFYKAPIFVGQDCCFERGATLSTSNCGNIKIGNHVYVGEYTVILSKGHLEIGDYTLIAPHVLIVDFDHVFSDVTIPVLNQGFQLKKVIIGRDVWIGAGCQILKGVTIGDGCVVGAGSVVTKDLPPYSVCVGNPAKIIRSRK